MDFSTVETWIDLLVMVVAFVAVIVGVITGIKMFKSADHSSINQEKEKVQEKEKPKTAAKKVSEAKSVTSKIPKVTEAVSPVGSNQIKSVEKSVSASSDVKTAVIEPKAATIDLTNAPKLEADHLSLDTPNTLLLKLRVSGAKLIYKKIQTNDHNELDIMYKAPERDVHTGIEEFDQGSNLIFTLSGKGIIARTYHFTIYYGDGDGNLYTQQIAGMGKEYPIVDVPRKIA